MHVIHRSASWSLIVVSWLAGACTVGPGTSTGGSTGSSGGSTGAASSTGEGSSGGTEGTPTGSEGSSGATPTSGGTTTGGTSSGGTSSGGTDASSGGTEATTGGVRCEAAVGVTDCAVLVKLAEELTLELCTTCQGATCGTEPDCDSQFPCVEGRIVVQGCCGDEDCAGLSPFCGMFIAINNVCVLSDDV